MLGDGGAELTKKLGLEVELPGMGVRLKRCSILVDDGVVKQVNVEPPREFGVSSAEHMLSQL
jgi:peroxiredoxin